MSNMLGRAAVDIHVPEGDYPEEPLLAKGIHQGVIVEITEGTRDDGEQWAKVLFELVGGPHHGRRIADWLGWGGNQAKEEISNKKFKTLLTLCGVNDVLTSYDQLYGTMIGINNKPYQGQDGSLRNSINFYKRGANPMMQATPAAPAPAARAPVQQAPAPAPAPAPQPSSPGLPPMPPPPPPQQYAAPPPVANSAPPVGAPPPVQQQQYYQQPAQHADHWDGTQGEPPF